MFFIILTFAAALFIEGLGSLVSVIGISALFGANPIIIALAIALDVGKVVTVSLLYTYWKALSKLMKTYALMAATVTMIITSAGAAGYLTGEFQKSIMATREGDLKVAVMKEQQAKYELRKKQIDDQIASLPARTTVNQRLRMVRAFQAEQKALDAKIAEIDKQLPALQVAQIGTEAKAGPIVSISKAFKIPMEEAVSWVIAMIIFVFDPLAIFLIIAGNFLWARRKAELAAKAEPAEPVPTGQMHEDVNWNRAQPHVNRFEPDMFKPAAQPTTLKDYGIVDSVEPVKDDPPLHKWTQFPIDPKKDDIFFHPEHKMMYIFDGVHWIGANTLSMTDDKVWLDKADEARTEGFVAPEPVETTYEKYEKYEEPAPVVEPEPAPVVEPEPEPIPELIPELSPEVEEPQPTYQQTGVLSPVNVDPPEIIVVPDETQIIPMKVKPLPLHREEITRSTLGIVEPDPATIVDAGRSPGFRRATSKK